MLRCSVSIAHRYNSGRILMNVRIIWLTRLIPVTVSWRWYASVNNLSMVTQTS